MRKLSSIALIALVCLYSCGKSNDRANKKLLAEVLIGSPTLDTLYRWYSFKYDDKARMTEFTDWRYQGPYNPFPSTGFGTENAKFSYQENGQLASIDMYYTDIYFNTQYFKYSGNQVEQSEYLKDSNRSVITRTYNFTSIAELEKYRIMVLPFQDIQQTSLSYDTRKNIFYRKGYAYYDHSLTGGTNYSSGYIYDDKKGMMSNVNPATPLWWFVAQYNFVNSYAFMFYTRRNNVAELHDTLVGPAYPPEYETTYRYVYDSDGYPVSMKLLHNNVEAARFGFKYSQ